MAKTQAKERSAAALAGDRAALQERRAALAGQREEFRDGIRQDLGAGRDPGKRRETLEAVEQQLRHVDQDLADLQELEAAATVKEADEKKQADKARAPVLVRRALEKVTGQEDRVRAVLLEVQAALEAEILQEAADAQRLRAEVTQDGNDLYLERRLRTLQHLVAYGIAELRKL